VKSVCEAVLAGPALSEDQDRRWKIERPFEHRDLAREDAIPRAKKGLERASPPRRRPLGCLSQEGAAKRPVSFVASPQSRSRA
jgi:hypothetical protein